jgi:hypothetical protein
MYVTKDFIEPLSSSKKDRTMHLACKGRIFMPLHFDAGSLMWNYFIYYRLSSRQKRHFRARGKKRERERELVFTR